MSTDWIERVIRVFDGTPSTWRVYEKRALMLLEKLKFQGKQSDSGLLLAAGLSGDARQKIDSCVSVLISNS